MLARYDEQQAKCGQCGRPVAECSDPNRDRFPQRSVCFETMARLEAQRQYAEAHKGLWHDGTFTTWLPKRTSMTPFTADDGVTIWLSSIDLTPDEDFLSRPKVGSYEHEGG